MGGAPAVKLASHDAASLPGDAIRPSQDRRSERDTPGVACLAAPARARGRPRPSSSPAPERTGGRTRRRVESLRLHDRVEHAVRPGVDAGSGDPLPVADVARDVAVDEQVGEDARTAPPVDPEHLREERPDDQPRRGCASTLRRAAGACPRRRSGTRSGPRRQRSNASSSSLHAAPRGRRSCAAVAGFAASSWRKKSRQQSWRTNSSPAGPHGLARVDRLGRRHAAEVEVRAQARRALGREVVAPLAVLMEPVREPPTRAGAVPPASPAGGRPGDGAAGVRSCNDGSGARLEPGGQSESARGGPAGRPQRLRAPAPPIRREDAVVVAVRRVPARRAATTAIVFSTRSVESRAPALALEARFASLRIRARVAPTKTASAPTASSDPDRLRRPDRRGGRRGRRRAPAATSRRSASALGQEREPVRAAPARSASSRTNSGTTRRRVRAASASTGWSWTRRSRVKRTMRSVALHPDACAPARQPLGLLDRVAAPDRASLERSTPRRRRRRGRARAVASSAQPVRVRAERASGMTALTTTNRGSRRVRSVGDAASGVSAPR